MKQGLGRGRLGLTLAPISAGCTYEGRERPDGSRWLSSSTPCMACMCADGIATCAEIVCISSCINQIEVPGECCPLCAGKAVVGRSRGVVEPGLRGVFQVQ